MFDEPAALADVLGSPLTRFTSLDVVFRLQPLDAATQAVAGGSNAVRKVLASSTLSVDQHGAVTSCKTQVARKVNGKLADLCAFFADGATTFAAAATAGYRTTTTSLEVVAQPR